MDDKRILEKLDKLQDDVTDIKVTMAVNTQSLQEHMRRTELLEAKLKPLEDHVTRFNGVLKFFVYIGVLVGIVAGLFKILGH